LEANKINELIRAEIAKQKVLQKLTNNDIAKMTGYSCSAIRQAICGTYTGNSEKVTDAIAKALKIER